MVEKPMTDDVTIEARFDDAMMNVYRRALDACGYNASHCFQMLYTHRGPEAPGQRRTRRNVTNNPADLQIINITN
jgi:hypothetical protein